MDEDLEADAESEAGARRYFARARKNSVSLAGFVTLRDLLDFSSDVPIAVLASAIELHGISGWDRFGRFFENDPAIRARALDALGSYVDWCREEARKVEWPEYPSTDVADYPMEGELYGFAWAREALPDFQEISRAATATPEPPRRRSAEVKSNNTLLLIVAALAKAAGIDVKARGASRRVVEATELVGAPVSEETVRSVLQRIDEALERRGG